jgi:hypothetical protein
VPEPDGVGLVVETDQAIAGCRACGVMAAAHGRREQELHDAPWPPAGPGAVAQAGVAVPRAGLSSRSTGELAPFRAK